MEKKNFFNCMHSDCWLLRANALFIVMQLKMKYNIKSTPPILKTNPHNNPLDIVLHNERYKWFTNEKDDTYDILHAAIAATFMLDGTRDHNLQNQLYKQREENRLGEKQIKNILRCFVHDADKRWVPSFFGV